MNKKLNTFLFMVAATVGNIVIMVGMFILLLVIAMQVLVANVPALDPFRNIIIIVVILLSLVGTFFVYNLIMDKIMKKVDMEKYFHPIIKPRKR
jgi:amino acid transporter